MRTFIYTLLYLCVAAFAATAQIKNVYGPYLQNVKGDEATIVWESDKPSIGWVEIAPDDKTHFYGEERPKYFDTKNGVKKTSYLHVVKIKGLKPGTTYRYRIYSKEVLSHEGISLVYGQTAASNVYSKAPLEFTTTDPSKNNFSFIVLNDIHGRSNFMRKLLEVGDYKNKDMIIFNGDMVSLFKDKETIFDGFMKDAVEMFASEKPMYYARGNHETRGEFATSFQDYFSPKEEFLYYTFRQGNVCFIFLDTGEDKPDSDIEYGGITDYDGYRTEQAEWLEGLKDNEDYKNSKFRVVVQHMPPSNDTNIWHGQKELNKKFVPKLNNLSVDVMFCGHLHKNKYEEASSDIKFPVLVNSNMSLISVSVDGDTMTVKVIDENGKILNNKIYKAK